VAWAENFVAWGYSFPPTDFAAWWLLRRARRIRSLIIINPDIAKPAWIESIRHAVPRGVDIALYPDFYDSPLSQGG
jgi:hypothetical protein